MMEEKEAAMPHARHSSVEIVRRGEDIYQREIRPLVEPEHRGKFLVLDIETKRYEIDSQELAALKRAMADNPDGARYLLRIGYPAAHRIGGPLRAERS